MLRLLSVCSVQAVGQKQSLPKDPPCSSMQVTTCRITRRIPPTKESIMLKATEDCSTTVFRDFVNYNYFTTNRAHDLQARPRCA